MSSRIARLATSCLLCASAVAAACTTTGCQVSVGDQTLPSAYYMQDDIQYHPKGPEFKLWREAAAMKAAQADALSR